MIFLYPLEVSFVFATGRIFGGFSEGFFVGGRALGSVCHLVNLRGWVSNVGSAGLGDAYTMVCHLAYLLGVGVLSCVFDSWGTFVRHQSRIFGTISEGISDGATGSVFVSWGTFVRHQRRIFGTISEGISDGVTGSIFVTCGTTVAMPETNFL